MSPWIHILLYLTNLLGWTNLLLPISDVYSSPSLPPSLFFFHHHHLCTTRMYNYNIHVRTLICIFFLVPLYDILSGVIASVTIVILVTVSIVFTVLCLWYRHDKSKVASLEHLQKKLITILSTITTITYNNYTIDFSNR